MRISFVLAITALSVATPCEAADLRGPARFCGYAPIIDLLRDESVTTMGGGIHGGSFRWNGKFGSLIVHGIGWARRPDGESAEPGSNSRPAVFKQRRVSDGYEIAIWNGAHGAAYFNSAKPFTPRQLEAIRRVTLFEEGETPSNCKLRTTFDWNFEIPSGEAPGGPAPER
jgi:hypothetical protein